MAVFVCVALGGITQFVAGARPAGATRFAPAARRARTHPLPEPEAEAKAKAKAKGASAKDTKLSPCLTALASAPTRPRGLWRQASVLGLPATGAGSLIRRPGGRVLVEIRTANVGRATLAALESAGAHVVNVSSTYETVTADVATNALSRVAANSAVRYVGEVLAPRVASAGPAGTAAGGSLRAPSAPGVATASVACGANTSEADTEMNVATARDTHNLDGTGETVGLLSDSFDTASGSATDAATDVSTGDLPGAGNPCGYPSPVFVQSDFSGGNQTDEGRGMAQLVHDLAPGANIAFATAFNGQLDFASQITKLRTLAHANVIADDVSYLDEPFFQNGPIANAANLSTASGVPYFAAAGNDNVVVAGRNVGSYMAPAFRATPCPAAVLNVEPLMSCHNFNPVSGPADNGDAITVTSGGTFGVDLQWAQPWGGVTTDFDVFLVDSAGNVVARSTINNLSSETPFEFVGYTNETVSTQAIRIVVGKFSGSANSRLKFVLSGAAGVIAVEHDTSLVGDVIGPDIFGHYGAAQVGSTAAIPYTSADAPESYSSRGPVTLYFDDTPSLTALPTPLVVSKPDFAATDGVQTTFFSQQILGVWRFFGTSAAAPEAAAVAALVKEDSPTMTAAAVLARLHDTARAVPTNGTPTDVGGGYIDADAALTGLSEVPTTPAAVTAIAGNGEADVRWTASTANPNFPVTGYLVTPYLSGVAQTPFAFDASAAEQVVAPLDNGGAYTFTVTATSDIGASAESAPSAVAYIGAPTAPANVIATAGNANAVVKWTPPASDNGFPVTGYAVTPYAAGVARPVQTFPTASTTGTVTALTNGVAYTFRVAAINANGAGDMSLPSAPITVGTPTVPLTPTAVPGNGAATVSWHAPASNNGAAVNHYFITPYRNGVAQPVRSFAATPLTQNLTGLANGSAYTFRIAASNTRGTGLSVVTAAIGVGTPIAPTAVHATAGPARASVHWTAPSANNGSAVIGYVVIPYVGTVAGTAQTFASTGSTEVVTGLTPGVSYTFTVSAKNSRGRGIPSAKTNAVVPT